MISWTKGPAISKAVILGVPRSGKSRLASRLSSAFNLNHYPIDSLVSALGEAYPQLGVGRQYSDAESTSVITPFLLSWISHLDYEGSGYVLEGYHIGVEAAKLLAEQNIEVVALGYSSADVQTKCSEIIEHARDGDWTSSLSKTELSDLVARYIEESKELERQCLKHKLAYFDIGTHAESVLESAYVHLVLTTEGP